MTAAALVVVFIAVRTVSRISPKVWTTQQRCRGGGGSSVVALDVEGG